jgi:hypothetical protein
VEHRSIGDGLARGDLYRIHRRYAPGCGRRGARISWRAPGMDHARVIGSASSALAPDAADLVAQSGANRASRPLP